VSEPNVAGSPNKPYIGGQAVIEGVMMRAPGCMSIAVRKPDGSIAVTEGPMRSKLAGSKTWKLPFVRGVATLVESMSLGYRALRFSAEQQLTEEERKGMSGSGGGAIFLSTAIAILVFMAAPQGGAALLTHLLGIDLDPTDWRFHALTGGFKLLIVTGYLLLISQMSDVKRVFQYHGAEHKTIYTYEQGLPLTVENVRAQSTLHPRCGTTFLIVVVFVSVIVGSLVTPLFIPADLNKYAAQGATLAIRLALLPFIAAISYELQRLSARYCTVGPLRVLLWPGFLFQKITTREPDDKQIEIAITAMQTAMWREKVGETAPIEDEPLEFESYEEFLEELPELRVA
jgi:uncharacterized protein YqhQ